MDSSIVINVPQECKVLIIGEVKRIEEGGVYENSALSVQFSVNPRLL